MLHLHLSVEKVISTTWNSNSLKCAMVALKQFTKIFLEPYVKVQCYMCPTMPGQLLKQCFVENDVW